MAKTAQERLEDIDNAIFAIEAGGQSYKIGSRQLTRADLATLYKMRDRTQEEINSQQSDGIFDRTVVAVFEGR